MTSQTFQIAVPLIDFSWEGEQLPEFEGLEIVDSKPDLRNLEEYLAEDEKDDLLSVRHWLTFDWQANTSPAPSEVTNLFLLSLWLVKPTKTHAKLRFHISRDPESCNCRFSRILTRFVWTEGNVQSAFSGEDLHRAARYHRKLLPIALREGRLYEAAVLHVTGCWASHWHVSFICHSAAIETLLTYSTAPRITRRLAKSFACLTRREAPKRDAAFRLFKDLYSTRSDISHGRTHTISSEIKLQRLAQLETVVRQIWREIFRSSKIRDVLEGSDEQRQAYFASLEADYNVPSR